MNYLNQLPYDNIKKLAVSIMEVLVKKGVNNDAKSLGADAIINVRITTSMIMQGCSEIMAYGTAVKLS